MGGGGAGGWMDGWMERKHSGGCIPRTQAMKPKLRAHDSDRFTVLGQAATGVQRAVTAPQAPLQCHGGPGLSTRPLLTVGSRGCRN